jgi:lysyl-tRNA synthetase, class I
VGVSAREMADFLPPEILRFLMIRTKPNNHVNFSPSEAHIVKLFNEYDRYHWRAFHDPKVSEEEKQVYFLSEVTREGPYFDADFQIVVTLCQMPHLDLFKEMEKRKGAPLTEVELKHLRRRIQAAKYWLERYATEEEKTRLQETLPARADELSDTQKAFLHILADRLPAIEWKDEIIQAEIFAAARLTPVDQPKAFQAIYRVLLDRESGPKAGNLLSFLERDFVINRCREIAVNKAAFWTESAMTTSELEAWLEKEKMKIAKAGRQIRRTNALGELAATGVSEANEIQALELFFTMNDGKTHCKRLLASEPSGQFTSDYLEHLQQAYGVQFS